MALEDCEETSHKYRRNPFWAPLHALNLFAGRDRPRVSVEPAPLPLKRSSRLHSSKTRAEDKGSQRSRHKERTSEKRIKGRAVPGRGEKVHIFGKRTGRQSDGLMSSSSSSLPVKRASIHRRASEGTGTYASATPHPRRTADSHQRHSHDDHNYHLQHNPDHLYPFPRRARRNRCQGASSSIPAVTESFHPRRSYNLISSASHRAALINDIHVTQEAAREARERLDIRLRSAALLSHKCSNRYSGAGLHVSVADQPYSRVDDDDDYVSPESEDEDYNWGTSLQHWFSNEWVPSHLGFCDMTNRCLHKEVFAHKGGKGLRKANFDGNLLEQEDCIVCLEQFLPGQLLIFLPCNHRFHSACLTPWLESHEHCPCCRCKIDLD